MEKKKEKKKQIIWLSSYSDADGTTHEFVTMLMLQGNFFGGKDL